MLQVRFEAARTRKRNSNCFKYKRFILKGLRQVTEASGWGAQMVQEAAQEARSSVQNHSKTSLVKIRLFYPLSQNSLNVMKCISVQIQETL